MKLGKPFLTVQCPGSYTKTLEVIEYIGLNTLQPGLGGFDAVSVDTKGQVLSMPTSSRSVPSRRRSRRR